MKKLLEQLEEVEKSFTVSANPEVMERFQKLLGALQWCNCGASRQIKFSIDGDGADRFKITKGEKIDLTEPEAKALENDTLSL